MSEFRMPSLGADMEAGKLIEWKVKPGDHVSRGDIVAVVDTDKAAIEIEIFETGTVQELLVAEGTKVPVGTPLALIAADGTEAAAVPSRAPSEPARPEAPPPARRLASPLARRAAHELGVDLSRVAGTGPGGAITRADIERAAAARDAETPQAETVRAQATPEPSTQDRKAAMRQAIGALMARSKREIPHYYLATDIDMKPALAWLEEHNAERPATERLLPAALLLKAVALATHDVPEMNGFWMEGAFRPGDGVHVGVAISLRQGGLIAPAIRDVDEKSLDELMTSLRDLVQRARSGVLRASEMSEPTITVTNLGDQGVETVFGVIYPPQVALVGFGKIGDRPWASGGLVGSRPLVKATLAADHRASDGHRGGLFLAAVDHFLQEPDHL
ncbi:MAG: dihydrolipoamide acetyltransferase family protein [Actinomycetota bacterium]